MKAKTRIAAIFLAAAMILGFTTGCADTRTAMTINGIDVRAGEYIMAQIYAAQDGAGLFAEANPDVNVNDSSFNFYKQQLDGKDFADWVNDEAFEICKERIAYEKLFNDMGLELPEGRQAEIREHVTGLWENKLEDNEASQLGHSTWGAFFESVGIGRESRQKVMTYESMAEIVFDAHFGEGGTMEIPESEIRDYFAEKFIRFRVLQVDVTEGMTEEEISELEAQAQGYADRLKAGESFVEIYDEYQASKAIQFEPEENPPEENPSSESEEPEENEEDPAESEEEPAESEEESDEEEIDENRYDLMERTENPFYTWPDGMHDGLVNMTINEVKIVRVEDENVNAFYVLQKLDINEHETWFEEDRETLLYDMKKDEMKAIARALGNTFDAERNDAAIKRYKPEKAAPKKLLIN